MTIPDDHGAANVRWTVTSQVAHLASQLATVLVFSRLLPPAAFGLLAMSAVISNLAVLFRDMGVRVALVQRRELTGKFVGTALLTSLALGLVTSLVVALGAPLASAAFGQPDLTLVILALSPSFLISALGIPHLALLERAHRFKDIARAEIASSALAFGVAVLLARLGAGVFSLVSQTIVASLLSTILFRAMSPGGIRITWSRTHARELWSFGGNLLTFNLVTYMVRNGDAMLIGRALGDTVLGWYNMANRILLIPLQTMTVAVNRALLPVYSRQQDDLAELGRLYLRSITIIGAIVAPMMLGLWAVRKPFIDVTLGLQWRETADILAWFAPMSVLQSISSTTGTVYSALGNTSQLRTLGIVNAAIIVVSFVVGIRSGLHGLVVGYFIATCIVSSLSVGLTLRMLRVPAGRFVHSMAYPLLSAMAMALLVSSAGNFMANISSLPRLALLVGLGAITYTLIMAFWKASPFRRPR